MTLSRLYHVTLILFWIALLGMLSLMCIHAPEGGLDVAGLRLFPGPGYAGDYAAGLADMGFGAAGQAAMLGLIAACDMAAAGLLVFAMLFVAFGQMPELHDALGIVEGASAILALAAVATTLPVLAAGKAAALAGLQIFALAGCAVARAALPGSTAFPAASPAASDNLGQFGEIVAGHAPDHAALTARLASITRKGPGR